MVESDLLQRLASKSISKAELVSTVEADFNLVPKVLEGCSSPVAAIRYGCGSILVDLTAKHPENLYRYMDEFILLLDSKYRILVWNAMASIANLASVDHDKKFDAKFEKFYSLMNDEYLVTVANLVGYSGKIAMAKPYLIPRITAELLRVEDLQTTPHLTLECKRVIAEKALESFNQFFSRIEDRDKPKVLSFARRCLNSPRRSLSAKAASFLKRWS